MTKEEIQELGNAIVALVNGAYVVHSGDEELNVSTVWSQDEKLHATLHKIFGDKGETK